MIESGTSRGSKPLSLNNLSLAVMDIIKRNETISFKEVADKIINEMHKQSLDEANTERTIRRRVYDVLNVFFAADIISKDNKMIKYKLTATLTPSTPIPPRLQSLYERCEQKHEILMMKLKLLLSYQSLITRNASIARPSKVIHLPLMIVGFNSNIDGGSNRSLDGKSLEIHASENPTFYSPMNIFDKMQIPFDQFKEILKKTSGLSQLETDLEKYLQKSS